MPTQFNNIKITENGYPFNLPIKYCIKMSIKKFIIRSEPKKKKQSISYKGQFS
jgi:hypothetical protein